MAIIEHASIGDHLKHIMNVLDTVNDPVLLPSETVDTTLATIATRISDFTSIMQNYDFSATYFNSALYFITYDVELLVMQVPYSDRVLVRNTISKVRNTL